MTDAEIIEKLAKFMSWKKVSTCCDREPSKFPTICEGCHEHSCFSYKENPLKDWNHWRQVEEKVMEDSETLIKMIREIGSHITGDSLTQYIISDLPTRCSALVSVLDRE